MAEAAASALKNLSLNEKSCPTCNKPASKICVGCRKVSYCSKDCQKAHFKEHKAQYRIIADERLILRVAHLVKKIFLTIAEHMYNNKIQKLKKKSNNLVAVPGWLDDEDNTAIVPFPPLTFFGSQQIKEAVLSHYGCNFAVALSYQMLELLLVQTGAARSLCEVKVDIKKQPLSLRWEPSPPEESFTHIVNLFRMKKSNTDWVVDLTGSQFGFFNEPAKPLMAFQEATGTSTDNFEKFPFGHEKGRPYLRQPTLDPWKRRVLQLSYDCADQVSASLIQFHHQGKPLTSYVEERDEVWAVVESEVVYEANRCTVNHLIDLHAPDGLFEKDKNGISVFKNKITVNESPPVYYLNFDDSIFDDPEEMRRRIESITPSTSGK